jgi:hypothetical protein
VTDSESATSKYGELLAKASAAGLGTAAGITVAGPLGGILGAFASQIAVDSTSSLLSRLGDRRRQRPAIAVQYAADRLGLPVEEITKALGDEPDLERVTITVMIGALSTESQSKLFAYGRVLANVLQDRARVDEEQFLAQALIGIEAPHVRLLGYLEEEQQKTFNRPISQYAFASLELGSTFRAVIQTLESAGLIYSQSRIEMKDGPLPKYPMPGDQREKVPVVTTHWGITRLGELLMERFRQVSREEAEGQESQSKEG